MKTIRHFICGALLLFIGSASLSAQTNYVPNGNFEELDSNGKPLGWYDTGGSWGGSGTNTNVFSDTDVPSGNTSNSSKSGKYYGPSATLSTIKRTDIYNIPNGAKFDISFWIKGGQPLVATDGCYVYLQSAFQQGSPTDIATANREILLEKKDIFQDEWIYVEYVNLTGMSTDDKPWFKLWITVQNNVSFLLDDVSITLQEETTTNLIPNGNFEEVDANAMPVNWYDSYEKGTERVESSTIVRTNDNNTNSTKSGKFMQKSGSNVFVETFIEPVDNSKNYKLSFWYKFEKEENTGGNLALNIYNTDGSPQFTINNTLENEDFELYQGDWIYFESNNFSVLNSGSGYDMEFNGSKMSYLILDDVQMVEATETGITDVKADTKLPVYVSDGILYVGGTTAGETVSVYSITGQTLKSETAQSTTTKITGLSGGQVYIVRSGSKSAKVVL
jgi:hypothetical protein